MKALSLSQPWASLVVDGRKRIETRSWKAPAEMIGQRFAIHAAKSVDKEACRQFGYDPETIPRGLVLGIVRLIACTQFTRENTVLIRPEEKTMGDFTPGRFGYLLELINKFETPRPAKGSLGFWLWDDEF